MPPSNSSRIDFCNWAAAFNQVNTVLRIIINLTQSFIFAECERLVHYTEF